jgi:nucleoside-diphosphate-sugar epimerase
MRAAVTGATGFIGRSLVRQLRERGDAVVALVRDAGKAGTLRELGCEVEEVVLGGEIATLREVVQRAAAAAGRRPPWLTTPSWLLHAVTPFGGLIGRPLAGEPNLREMVRASDGVTYWATDARARVELGYAPRDLGAGLPTLLASR